MRVAIYARVSTTNKRQDINLQLSELRQYALSRNWAIAAEYCDIGVSGIRASRPQLDQLMTAAKQGSFDVVLVWKLDRFARSLRHLLSAVTELEAAGVKFASSRDSIDLSTPAGRFMFQMIGAFAEFERGLLQERVKAGMAHAKAKGVKFGRTRSLIDHDQIRTLRASGMSWSEVAKAANTSVGTIYRQMQPAVC